MRIIVCTLFVLGLLWDSVRAENSIHSLRMEAAAWGRELPCRKWYCECAFKLQRCCCCATLELKEAEDQICERVMDLSMRMSQLGDCVLEVIGIFTAPCPGLYSFSFSAYSKVGGEGERMYYKVQLMRNGEVVASTWEDNREDSEDSSSQTVLLSLQQGGQVYVELLRGRLLCGITEGLNTFSGFLMYPALA